MIGLPNWLNRFRKQTAGGGGGGGGGTYALVGHATGNDVSSAVATITDTTGAKLIIAAMSFFAGTPAVTDNKGNTYQPLTSHVDASTDYFARLFYCIAPSVGASHALTGTASGGGFIVLSAAAFSLSSGTPTFDSENGTNHDSSNVTTLAGGTLAPSVNNQLLVAAVTWNLPGGSPRTVSINSGFTITDQSQQGSNNLFGGLAYLIQTTGGSVSPTWTFSDVINDAAAADATFK